MALVAALVCGSVPPVLALTVTLLPLDEDLKERLATILLSRIRLFTGALVWLVDRVGPSGMAEPASMYLPHWAAIGLGVLAVALAYFVLFCGIYAGLWLLEAKPSGAAGNP